MSSARRPREAFVLAAVGIAWLAAGVATGAASFLLALLPGSLMLTAGVATLVLRGDPRLRHLGALGAVAGLLLGLPLVVSMGAVGALGLAALAALALVAEGRIGIATVESFAGVPVPETGVRTAAEVGADDAILALMVQSLPAPRADDHTRIAREVEDARGLFAAEGWLADPAKYHPAPPALEAPESVTASFRGLAYRQLRYESGYEPYVEEPGRERWLAQTANRTAHAWVLQHEGPPRPWLVCIHGYQMGLPWMDLSAFQAKKWHRERGLNLAFPVLPLHGPRMRGRISGDGTLSAEFLDSVHALAQAMWDIRQLVGWIREQEAPGIGVYGLSLGGYTASLLAGLEGGLACAVAGIPAVDFARLVWRHGPAGDLAAALDAGLERAAVDEILRVVSPLSFAPKLPRERRAIFGATADQLVPPDQVRDLWRHWDEPEIAWYPGAHLGFMLHPHVGRLTERTVREAGLVA